jgi:hypothetical protein
VKRWKKIYHACTNQKQAGVTNVISEQVLNKNQSRDKVDTHKGNNTTRRYNISKYIFTKHQ